ERSDAASVERGEAERVEDRVEGLALFAARAHRQAHRVADRLRRQELRLGRCAPPTTWANASVPSSGEPRMAWTPAPSSMEKSARAPRGRPRSPAASRAWTRSKTRTLERSWVA